MNKKLKQITWLLTGILLINCSTQTIYINENGTASVVINLFDSIDKNQSVTSEKDATLAIDSTEFDKKSLGDYRKSIRELYSSDIISNFIYDTTANEIITFDIKHVDSLGTYLDPLFGTSFDFRLTKNKLLITGPDGNSDPEDDITGSTNMIPVYAILKFEKQIKSVTTKNNYIKKIDSQTIEIKTSIGEMNYNGIGNKVEIFFE
jgi:hypothetical protein